MMEGLRAGGPPAGRPVVSPPPTSSCSLLVSSLLSLSVLWATESRCSAAPLFQPSGDVRRLREELGSTVTLNCTALLPWEPQEEPCDRTLHWTKDGQPPDNHTQPSHNSASWSPAADQLWVSSTLVVHLQEPQDFGTYSCHVRNASADFCIHAPGGSPQLSFAVFVSPRCVLTTGVDPALILSPVLSLKTKNLLALRLLPQHKLWNLSSPVGSSLVFLISTFDSDSDSD